MCGVHPRRLTGRHKNTARLAETGGIPTHRYPHPDSPHDTTADSSAQQATPTGDSVPGHLTAAEHPDVDQGLPDGLSPTAVDEQDHTAAATHPPRHEATEDTMSDTSNPPDKQSFEALGEHWRNDGWFEHLRRTSRDDTWMRDDDWTQHDWAHDDWAHDDSTHDDDWIYDDWIYDEPGPLDAVDAYPTTDRPATRRQTNEPAPLPDAAAAPPVSTSHHTTAQRRDLTALGRAVDPAERAAAARFPAAARAPDLRDVPAAGASMDELAGGSATARGAVDARFLLEGDRVGWDGVLHLLDDPPIVHDGLITVPTRAADGRATWTELPVGEWVTLHDTPDTAAGADPDRPADLLHEPQPEASAGSAPPAGDHPGVPPAQETYDTADHAFSRYDDDPFSDPVTRRPIGAALDHAGAAGYVRDHARHAQVATWHADDQTVDRSDDSAAVREW